MTRHLFGGSLADWAIAEGTDLAALLASGAEITGWNQVEGGVQYVLTSDPDGTQPITVLSSDGTDGRMTGQIGEYYGPDDVWDMYVSANGGPRVRVLAADLAVSVAAIADTATQAAAAADTLNASRGQPSGLATLDATGKVPAGQLPGALSSVGTKWLNAVDYGAKGDDTTDDYAAITAALAAAAEGDIVYLPRGTYRISKPLKLGRNQTIMGTDASQWPYKSGVPACIKPHSSWVGDALIRLLDKEQSGAAGENEGARLRHVMLDGNGVGTVPTGLIGVSASGHVQDVGLDNVGIRNCKGGGVVTAAYTRTDASVQICSGWRMDHVAVAWGATGFILARLTDSSLYDCLAVATQGDGFRISDPSDNHLIGCRSVFNAQGAGFVFSGANGGLQLTSCSTDRNGLHGFSFGFTDGRQPVVLTNCYARRDGAAAAGQGYSGLYITGTSASPHPPVIVTGFAAHVSKGDSGEDPASPDYGVQVSGSARGVTLLGANVAGVVAAMLDSANAVTIGPGCGFNKTSSAGLTQTWDTDNRVRLVGPAGGSRSVEFFTTGAGQRWTIGATNKVEDGAGGGSDFAIARYGDTGAYLDHVLYAMRSSGRVGIGSDAPSAKLHVESSASEIMLNLINTNPALGAGGLIKLLTQTASPVNALQMGYLTDTTVRYNVKTDGTTEWGPGGTGSRDTNLYRSAADTLATDDDLLLANKAKGLILVDSAGGKHRLVVSSAGALSTVAV